jgi:membrane associated rhomboid family serine protease
MGAYLILYPRSRVLTLVFIFLIPIPAVVILVLWFVLQFASGVSSLGMATSGGVAWWAHVGGFLLGMGITSVARRR